MVLLTLKTVKLTQLHSVPATVGAAPGRDTEGVSFDAQSAYHAYGVSRLPGCSMMGSYTGVLKIAAKRVGVSFDEYQQCVEAGLKWCTNCRSWKPVELFCSDRNRGSGRAAKCGDCAKALYRETYVPKERPLRAGPAPKLAEDGNKEQARQRVNAMVKWGRLPRPNDAPCFDCGHRYAEGERRHEYDHFLGYDAQHHLAVQAVCTRCHGRRTKERGELKGVRRG